MARFCSIGMSVNFTPKPGGSARGVSGRNSLRHTTVPTVSMVRPPLGRSKEIRIGVLLPLTGYISHFGVMQEAV